MTEQEPTMIAGLSVEDYTDVFCEVRDRAASLLERDPTQVAFILMEYEDIFGEQAVLDLQGFMHWCNKNNDSKNLLRVTVAHDLYDRKEPFMSPRTEGYKEHRNQS